MANQVRLSALVMMSAFLVFALTLMFSAPSLALSKIEKREFNPTLDGRWIGNGISYGAYRDGEGPGKGLTSKENILEDLQIIAKRWNLIRLYGSDQQTQNILEVIQDNNLPIRVMLGIWLDGHKTEAENNSQLKLGVELANRFPEIVIAVNVGNEIFVYWSWHKLDDMDKVIRQIRDVRANIKQPVTVSDDYNFWNKPEAKKVADELDFICLHGYAIWNKQMLKDGMAWTEKTYQDIQNYHPEHRIAFCETGWPTSKVSTGDSDEARLVKGKVGQTEQKIFFDQYDQWVNRTRSFLSISHHLTSNGKVALMARTRWTKWKNTGAFTNRTERRKRHFNDKQMK